MKILLLAPHPFYQERGTPIAVDLLVRALTERGEDVDVLAYHEGADRHYPGPGKARIFRISRPPACRNIRPGFSLKKIVADIWMYGKARALVRENPYDVIHAVEESVFMAGPLGRRGGIPYVFDMDSSMPEQIVDKLPWLKPVLPLFRRFERGAIRRAAAVAVVCDALADLAGRSGAARVFTLRDVPLLNQGPAGASGRGFRQELGLAGPCALYIGNLEPYQGIDLLLKSWARVPPEFGASLVIVGGNPVHVERYRALAAELGLGDRVRLVGPRPLGDMSALMAETDILVSPRTQGTNTPMKIYSYMAAGKAIAATNLFTHTQVLNPGIARLAAPEAGAFAAALTDLLRDRDLRDTLGRAAAHAVATAYSMEVFSRTVGELYDSLKRETAG
jgi:glycosyltransferase involved in cell wall biosynthesis